MTFEAARPLVVSLLNPQKWGGRRGRETLSKSVPGWSSDLHAGSRLQFLSEIRVHPCESVVEHSPDQLQMRQTVQQALQTVAALVKKGHLMPLSPACHRLSQLVSTQFLNPVTLPKPHR